MGSQGTGKGFSGDVVLDAGALIAFERGDEHLKSILRGVLAMKARIVIPVTALAQVWRGGPNSAPLARLIDAGEVEPLDEKGAKEVGVRLGLRGDNDIADAQVVSCALEYRAAVATSDPGDIRGLAAPGESLALIAV